QQVVDEYVPEARQGFGYTQFPSTVPGISRRITQGVGPLTAKVAEDIPREVSVRATVIAAAKEAGRRIPVETTKFNQLAREMLSDPTIAKRAITEADKALGNYLNMSEFERNYIRALVPFYGWLRAITKIAGNAALDTPGRVDLLTKIGTVGDEWVRDELGRMPDFLTGLIPLGHA